MKLAVGVIVSNGYRAETDFIFGRADSTANEGLFALYQRLVSGQVNQALPAHQHFTDVRLNLSRRFPTDVARNEICAEVLKSEQDYLLFLDADMVHPANLVERLLSADKPVISARYQTKKAPFASIAYVKHKTQTGPHRYASIHFGQGVFEIERGGAGALLIRRDVLQAIYDRVGHNWFRYQRMDGKDADLTVSEDFWFYQQAREAGFSCWIDWDCVVPHLGTMAIDDSWNKPFLHTQMAEYENPEARDMVLKNTIVRNYANGMYLGDDQQFHVPEYQLTAGER